VVVLYNLCSVSWCHCDLDPGGSNLFLLIGKVKVVAVVVVVSVVEVAGSRLDHGRHIATCQAKPRIGRQKIAGRVCFTVREDGGQVGAAQPRAQKPTTHGVIQMPPHHVPPVSPLHCHAREHGVVQDFPPAISSRERLHHARCGVKRVLAQPRQKLEPFFVRCPGFRCARCFSLVVGVCRGRRGWWRGCKRHL